MNPATSKAVSSRIPSWIAAVNPIIHQKKGISKMNSGIFVSLHRRMPKVNIVVGQGSPNVGEDG